MELKDGRDNASIEPDAMTGLFIVTFNYFYSDDYEHTYE